MCDLSNIYINMSDDGERDLAEHVKTIKKCMLIWQIQIISSSIDSTILLNSLVKGNPSYKAIFFIGINLRFRYSKFLLIKHLKQKLKVSF